MKSTKPLLQLNKKAIAAWKKAPGIDWFISNTTTQLRWHVVGLVNVHAALLNSGVLRIDEGNLQINHLNRIHLQIVKLLLFYLYFSKCV